MLEDKYITFAQAMALVGLSRASIERYISKVKYHHGDPFPKKMRPGTNRGCKVFFEKAAVIAWLERRMR